MKQTTKKSLSLMLSLVMLITSFSAFAITAEAKTYTKNIKGVKYSYQIKKGKAEITFVTQTRKFKGKTIKIPSKLAGKKVVAVKGMSCHGVNITVPNTVLRFGRYDDYEAPGPDFYFSNIGTIKIGKNVKFIANNPLTECKKFVVNKKNKYYCSVDGVLYNKKKTKIIVYPALSSRDSFTILKTVKTINHNAFAGAKIKTLNIYNVSKICEYAFDGSDITTINAGAYLNSLPINADSNEMNCYKLRAFNVSENNKTFSSKDGVLFNKNQTKLIFYPYSKTAQSYTIPSSVTEIGVCAFGCEYLKDVIIPSSVKLVKENAFLSGSIKSVTVYGYNTKFEDCAILRNMDEDLVIKGYSGSTAEKYANECGITFYKL